MELPWTIWYSAAEKEYTDFCGKTVLNVAALLEEWEVSTEKTEVLD